MERALYDMQQEHEAKERLKPVKQPRTTHCTGCNVRFSEDYEVDDERPDCGYMACESCSCSNSRGSCYCEKSNFGRSYCDSVPQYYHGSGKRYKGDRHPDDEDLNATTHPKMFETEPRACNNCGEIARCLKKEYL